MTNLLPYARPAGGRPTGRTQESFLVRKGNQISMIEKNIHIIEGLRNKINYSYSELCHVFDLISCELEQVYNKYYPAAVLKSVVNTNKHQRKYFILHLLKDTTLDLQTIEGIVNIQNIYRYAVNNSIWPSCRKKFDNNPDASKKIEFVGNKREITVIINRIKKVMDSTVELDPTTDKVVYVEDYIRSENAHHIRNKGILSNKMTNLIMSADPDDFAKLPSCFSELKIELERHNYTIKSLLALSGHEQEKICLGVDQNDS